MVLLDLVEEAAVEAAELKFKGVKMESKKIIIMVLLVLGISFILGACTQVGPPKYDEFAQCLTEKEVKMYGTEWCSHCKNQKELFGSSFDFVDYIDCDLRSDECQAAGIKGYPTWKINGESYPGEQTIEKLASLTGCIPDEYLPTEQQDVTN